MRRYQLFEFEDLPYFPKKIRNYGTDFLQFVANQFNFYEGLIPILQKGIQKSGRHQIIDLASGGGGGWKSIIPQLQKVESKFQIRLTDLYPNITAFKKQQAQFPEVLHFENQTVSALNVPSNLKGLRTMFLSFHHFNEKNAVQILQNAVEEQQAILIVEAQERNLLNLIKFFFSPINVLLTTPFIRPFSIGRILFTYLIPIVPFFVWWDGFVSVLRTYTLREMKEMTEKLQNSRSFEWEIKKIKSGPVEILYLLGTPKSRQ
ncbi:hypothetical protein [Persicobacter diffluens]|uniref:Class I SAM-dependent methyltransferase n=1 Tax=Persicobacter diffluens TaxID=981 RepID=A0AAN5AL43_9BACT|nr:hypothetical protein PEDI_34110 [Persicobacter diffluens]